MLWVPDTCPITQEPAERRAEKAGDYEEYRCRTCGQFRVTRSALVSLGERSMDDRLELLVAAKRVSEPNHPIIIANI